MPALSFQTVAELYEGAYSARWGPRRLRLLQDELRTYAILPFQTEMTEFWARVRTDRKRLGRELDARDAWIAATAMSADCPLITHNRRDFDDIDGLTVISES